MKVFIISLCMLISQVSFAHEEIVFEGPQSDFSRGIGNFSSAFYVDQETGVAGVKVTFEKESERSSRSISKDIKLDNLYLEGKDLMLNLNGEMINCGTMGESRVFKVPTLYLSGNCSTRTETIKTGGFFSRKNYVKVYLNVKTSN